MSGWYVMHRGWMDSFKPEPFTEREAFLWSIEQASFESHEQWFNGQSIAVERGEFATSLRLMADAFGWSVKRVRGFMERMRKDEKWAHRQAHNGAQSPTIISVCNYDKYQRPSELQGTAKGTAKGSPGAQWGHSRGTQHKEGERRERKKEEAGGADAPSSYAFSGLTIRLTETDYDRWAETFHAIPDLRAELTALDAWYQTEVGAKKQAQWFHTTAGALARKHQAILGERREAEASLNVRRGGCTPIASPC